MKEKVSLFNRNSKKDKLILFEQYKIMTQSAENITEKRHNTNKFYLSVNSIITSLSSYLTFINFDVIPMLISIVGVLISLIWYQNINSYKELNSAKFRIIHEIENNLPINIYKKEHEYLRKKYYELTSIEKLVPFVFGILYIGIIFYIIIKSL